MIDNKNESIIKDRIINKMSYKKLALKHKKHFFTLKEILKDYDKEITLPKSNIKLPEQQIIDDYINGFNMYEIASKYNCSSSGVDKLLKRNNVTTRSRSEVNRIYQLNDNYFEEINTANKAYFLGFIMADGCITQRKNALTLSINLQDKDSYILEQFKKELNYEGKIYKLSPRKRNPNPQVMIRINSIKLCNDLSKYSVIPRKTFTIEFPNIDEKYFSHFIRGYFDGDGYIGKYGNIKKFNIISGSYILLDSIENIFRNIIGINRKKIYNKCNIFELSYGSKSDINKIFEYLYKDAEIYLQRKYNKFM